MEERSPTVLDIRPGVGGVCWLVSRHPGAVEWLHGQLKNPGCRVCPRAHLDLSEIRPGDVIIGTLPVHLIADARVRGARYIHLTIPIPAALRGQELSAEQLRSLRARLVEFSASRIDYSDWRQGTQEKPRPGGTQG